MSFGFLSDIGNLASGVAGVASLFDKPKEPRSSKQAAAAITEAIALAKASADPKSKAFRKLAKLEEQALRSAAVDQITSFLKQNQRNVARGGISGIVNPERRDEATMQALARSFQNATGQARNTARDTLRGAAGALTGAAQGLGTSAVIQNTVNQQERKRRADLGQAIGKGLGDLGGILDEWTGAGAKPDPFETEIVLT